MATPPRSNFYETVIDLVTTSPTYGKPISTNITVTVYVAQPYAAAPQTTLASVFSAETGATSPGNPITLPMAGLGAGEMNFWLNAGSYDIKVSDSSSPKRFSDRVVRFDADPGDKGTTREMMDDTLAAQLGVNNINGPTVRRGKSVIAGLESTTSTTYTLLSTADRVQNLKLETDGIIWVAYTAEVRALTAAGKAGIFLGNNQVQAKSALAGTGALTNIEASITQSASNFFQFIALTPTGPGGGAVFQSSGLSGSGLGASPPADPTTGYVPGGYNGSYSAMIWTPIVAAAGTYDVSVRYLAGASAQVWAQNRRLYVKTEAF